jgi:dihydroorotase
MKVYPPIRSEADRRSLWEAINDGTIHSVGSDHAPHTNAEKQQALATQPAGMQGIETLVPLMLDKMTQGVLAPATLARVLSQNTADLYGIGHRKGRIEVGADADLTIVDPERPFTIDESKHHTLQKRSVFHGHRGRGVAVSSVLRGEVLMRDGEPASSQPRGSLVRSQASTGSADQLMAAEGVR